MALNYKRKMMGFVYLAPDAAMGRFKIGFESKSNRFVWIMGWNTSLLMREHIKKEHTIIWLKLIFKKVEN